MTTHRSNRPNPKPAIGTPALGFDPSGVSARLGGGNTGALLRFLAFATTVLVTVFTISNLVPDDLAEEPILSFFNPAYLIPLILLTVAGLLSQRHSRIQLDPEGGGVKWTWSVLVPYKSRRDPVDLSGVYEVRLETGTRTVTFMTPSVGSQSTDEREVVSYSAILEGSPGPLSYGCRDYGWTRAVAEHFALGLGVPLRLSDDDVRAPEEICTPLRDRLAQRDLPDPVPANRGRLNADDDAAAGTTRVVLPPGGATGPIVVDAITLFIMMAILACFPMIWLAPNGPLSPRGLMLFGTVAAIAVAYMAFRARSSAVVTVLADGGFELVRCFPIGRRTYRIAGDDLDDVSVVDDPTDPSNLLEADGRHQSFQFGHGLKAGEVQWLESVLHEAIAGRSAAAH